MDEYRRIVKRAAAAQTAINAAGMGNPRDAELERLRTALEATYGQLTYAAEALKRVLIDSSSPPALTAAQVWYVSRVYPERVTDDEVRRQYEQAITREDDRSYWESAARVLAELAHLKSYA